MAVNLIVNSLILHNQFIKPNFSYLFFSYININTTDLFNFRIFLKNKRLIFKRLNTKQFSRVIKISSLKNVVLKIKNENYQLNSFNLSVIFINNFFIQIYLIIYFFTKYLNKVNILYLKINNIFLTFFFFNALFDKFFTNFNSKTFDFLQYVILINEKFFSILFHLIIVFYKLFFLLKLLLFFKIYFKFYQLLIK